MLDNGTKTRINNARDILVGKVPDPKAQVEQITTALIYKFMHDMDQESVELGGKAAFFVEEYAQYDWAKLIDTSLSGQQRLDLYVRALDAMSRNPYLPQLFRDIFKDAFLPYRDPETLNLFLKEINSFTYEHSERLGDAFEYLLSVLGSQGAAGQFRTPRHIIDFIVAAVAPSKTDTVLDPACGTAGFLISAFKHILAQNTDTPLSPDERQRLTENFVGYDIAPEMVRLSLVNMYLHNFREPTIYEYDTLSSEQRWDDTFDVILANPPFMSPKGGIRPHARFSIQSKRSEVLFVDYIAEHLNPDGRAGVIVPEGIIFQSSNAYKALRKMLVEENYLWAVVSLPAGVFNPYSGVKTSILLMDKQLAKRSPRILFLEVKNDGYDLGAQRRAIEKNDLPEALAALQTYQADPLMDVDSPLAHAVLKAKIAEEGDYNLSGGRFRSLVVISNIIWPLKSLKELCSIQSGTGFPMNFQGKHNEEIPFLKVSDMNTIGNEIFIKSWNNSVSKKDAQELNAKIVPNNSIIFPKIGAAIATNKKRILTIPSAFDNNVMGLIPGEKINSKYLYYLISHIDISDWASKAQPPSIRKSTVENFKIPLPPLEVQREIVAELDEYQTIITAARKIVESYTPRIPIDPGWEEVELGEIFNKVTENINPKEKKGEVIFIGLENIEANTGKLVGKVDNNYSEIKSSKSTFKSGDILYGKLRPNLNKVFLSDRYGICSTDLYVLRGDKSKIDPLFFTSYMRSKTFNDEVLKGISGAQLPRISWSYFSKIIIPLPTIDIQHKISIQIEREQDLIDANRELIEIFQAKIDRKLAEVWGE
jgi:type I restriction enzyme M protein